MDPIGILGIVISLLIAFWQYRKAKSTEEKLNNYLAELPKQLTENVTRFIIEGNRNNSDSKNVLLKDLIDSSHYTKSEYIDIDNDSNQELVVQFPFAAHGSAIQVYRVQDFGINLISEMSIDAPFGFEFEDIDSDGKLEIRAIETNRSSGLPYVCGLRDVVWYRLEGKEFVEIKRKEPSPKEIQERIKEMNE